MSDTIATFLMYTDGFEVPLSRILRRAFDANWELAPRFSDGYTYFVGEEYRQTASIDEVLADIGTATSASAAIEHGTMRVRLESNGDVLPSTDVPNLYIRSDMYEFTHERSGRTLESARANVESYLDIVEIAVRETEPTYGLGKWGKAISTFTIPTEEELAEGMVREPFWLNVFGPATVEWLGRDQVLAAPAFEIRELETGHVMIVTTDNPVEPADEWTDTQAELAEHLGLDYTPGAR